MGNESKALIDNLSQQWDLKSIRWGKLPITPDRTL
jgi:hypothetical protein